MFLTWASSESVYLRLSCRREKKKETLLKMRNNEKPVSASSFQHSLDNPGARRTGPSNDDGV